MGVLVLSSGLALDLLLGRWEGQFTMIKSPQAGFTPNLLKP